LICKNYFFIFSKKDELNISF